MNAPYYHTPPHPVSVRPRCPVCHQEVYSRAGIHPQCAVRQCDPPKPKNGPKSPSVAAGLAAAQAVVATPIPEGADVSDRLPV